MENEKNIELIIKQFNENINSHIFLVDTNNAEKSLIEIKTILKHLLKNDKIISKQIDDEIYLEWIIIRPLGKEIKKDQIELLQERLKIKPILSKNIFYTIVNAEKMNEISSNKLLKTIEEPNEGIIGFIITENIDQILPTIKSRCETLKFIYDEQPIESEEAEEVDKIVQKLITAIENNNLLEFNLNKNNLDLTNEKGNKITRQIKLYYDTSCNITNNEKLNTAIIKLIDEKNSYKTKIKKAKYLNKTLNKFTNSMNQDLLLEKIFIEIGK